MIVVRKKLVTDDDHQPVAVLIDYDDWLEIERLLSVRSEKKLITDLSEYKGFLTLTEDPDEYQRRIRDEWP